MEKNIFESYTVEQAKKEVKLINDTWKVFDYAFQCIKWGTEGNNYLRENITEEKLHDKGRPSTCRRFLTITEAGKLFAVKQLIEYLFTNKIPSLESYSYCRKSVYTAYSLAFLYKKELMEALNKIEGFNFQDILKIDYAGIQDLNNR